MDSFTPEQRSSVCHLDGPLLVSAGAGSGKTFTLTQRVAWALMPGSGEGGSAFLDSIDEVLVITFTEKAAAEIKERIRSALRAEGMLEEALKVDGAWISTIHGMCSRILREHALEVGMDPAFTVLDALKEEELRMMAIEAVLARTEEEGVYRGLFSQFGAKDVKEALGEILKMAHTLPDGLNAVDLGPEGTPIVQQLRHVYELASNPLEGGTKTYYEGAASLAAQLASCLKGIDEGQGIEALAQLDLRTGALRSKVAAELSAAVKDLRQAVLVAPFRQSAQLLLDLACQVDEEYQASLNQLGQIDMNGLIRKTLAIFEEYPQIAALYTQRFKLIMVDEFQDTSQLQIDMIERIAGAGRTRLCTVGDAQQSIYRFQGADVSVYLKHKQDMRAIGAQVVQLNDNFRSNADVLAFVRRVCGQGAYFSEPFLDLHAKKEGAPYKAGGPRIELSYAPYGAGAKTPANAGSARQAEARFVAQRFTQLHEAGHDYSDMVLLLGRMYHAQLYAGAMREAGVPCVVAGGSRFFEERPAKLCLELLGALANPYDATCLLSVLTSEVLPVSTDDLLFLSTKLEQDGGPAKRQNIARGFLLADAAPADPSPLLVHAIEVFSRAWSKLGKIRPAQILKEFVLDSGWLARLEAGGADQQAQAADVLKFIRLVEDAQSETGFDMARVAHAMRNRAAVASEKPGALSFEDLNAVRIMTIHSSKGLEFPIVAVADCYGAKGRGSKVALLSKDGVLHLSLAQSGGKDNFTPTSAGVAGAQEPAEYRANMICENDRFDYEERKRLFYVAATRASAALLVCMCVSKPKNGAPPPLAEDIQAALFGSGTAFPEADAKVDYGGSGPLQFTYLQAESKDEEADDGIADGAPASSRAHARANGAALAPSRERAGARDKASAGGPSRPDHIQVPVLEDEHFLQLVPRSPRADFFSYSSLASAHGSMPDDAKEPSGKSSLEVCCGADSFLDYAVNEDLAFAPITADADKATNFGSALHRACEWLALQVEEPSDAEVAAALSRVVREFDIFDDQRLQLAFDRWRGSGVRAWACSFDTLQPELPFVVALDEQVLEGEIDLFCAQGAKAGIVDYKTGGSPSETPDQLAAKHLLQAQCYALATLAAGYSEVELRFVRVEQTDPEDASQPQTVSYCFAAADLPDLRKTISLSRS